MTNLISAVRRHKSQDSSERLDSHRPWLSPLAWGWVLLGLSFGFLYLQLSTANPEVIRGSWFEGDTLFPVHVVMDLKEGYQLSDWTFPPSPNFFPDIVLAFAFSALTSKVALVNYLIGIVFLAVLCLCFQLCGRQTGLGNSWVRGCGILAAGIFYTLFVTTRLGSYARILFLPAYHTGTFVVSIGLVALALALFRGRMSKVQQGFGLCFLVLMAGLCSFGDVLLLVMLTVPMTATAFVAFVFRWIPRKRLILPVLALWAGTGGGIGLSKLLLTTQPSSVYTRKSVDNALIAWKVFYEHVTNQLVVGDPLHWLALVWLAICTSFVVAVCFQRDRIKRWLSADEESLGLFTSLMAFFGFSSLAMVGALVVGCHVHLVQDPWYYFITHYMQPTLFTPLFGVPLFFGTILPRHLFQGHWKTAAGGLMLSAAVVALTYLFPFEAGPSAPHRYKPAIATNVDAVAEKYNLKFGIAGYWKAREINLFSDRNLKVCPFDPQFNYFDWIQNRSWLTNTEPGNQERPPFDFLIFDTHDLLTEEMILARFGHPAQRVVVDEFSKSYLTRSPQPNPRRAITILIYNRPQDVAFRQMFAPLQ